MFVPDDCIDMLSDTQNVSVLETSTAENDLSSELRQVEIIYLKVYGTKEMPTNGVVLLAKQ